MEVGSSMAESDSPTTEVPAATRWIAIVGLVALCALLVALFAPLFHAPLFSDDTFSVNQVTKMEHWTEALQPDAFSYFRPVKNLFFFIMVKSGAMHPAYHMATVAAYLLATIGVFILCQRLLGNPLWGLAAAAIWALSASNVTIGAWASCLNISVAAAAMTFGLWAWDKWRETNGRPSFGILSFVLFALALCSYETAVSLAPLVVLLDLYRGRKLFKKGAMIRYAGIATLVICYLLIRGLQGADATRADNPSYALDIETWQVSASAPYFLWTHFLMWLAPWGRLECLGSYLWDLSIPAIILPFCWLLLIGAACLCIRFWKAGNLVIFGLAWFFIASFPSSNFIPLKNTPYADYYIPIPAIGLALVAVAILRGLAKVIRPNSGHALGSRRLAWALIFLIAGSRVVNLTAFQGWVQAWRNPVMILVHTAAARPYQYLSKAILSGTMLEIGKRELAEDYAGRTLQDTEELALPFTTLGQLRYDQGQFDEAAALFQIAANKRHLTQETRLITHFYLGRLIARDPTQADRAFAEFIEVLKYHNSKLHFQTILEASDLFDRAKRHQDRVNTLVRGLEIYPGNAQLEAQLKDARTKLSEEVETP